jgi:hypothetical protein
MEGKEVVLTVKHLYVCSSTTSAQPVQRRALFQAAAGNQSRPEEMQSRPDKRNQQRFRGRRRATHVRCFALPLAIGSSFVSGGERLSR